MGVWSWDVNEDGTIGRWRQCLRIFMIHTKLYVISLILLTSCSLSAQPDTSNNEHFTTIEYNNKSFQVIDFYSKPYDRSFLNIKDSSELKIIDTLLRIHKVDTFIVHRYYKYGNLIRTAEYDLLGSLRHLTNWKDSKVHGTSFTFDRSGQLTSLTHYDNWNLIHSIGIDSLGQLLHFHINDSVFGKSWGKDYYNSGALKEINSTCWENFESTDIRYYENGQLMSKCILNAGRHKAIDFYENGTVMAEYDFVDMTLFIVGRLVIYYPDGSVKQEAFYEESDSREGAGIRTGTWKWWDEEGNLVQQEMYENNVLIEERDFTE